MDGTQEELERAVGWSRVIHHAAAATVRRTTHAARVSFLMAVDKLDDEQLRALMDEHAARTLGWFAGVTPPTPMRIAPPVTAAGELDDDRTPARPPPLPPAAYPDDDPTDPEATP